MLVRTCGSALTWLTLFCCEADVFLSCPGVPDKPAVGLLMWIAHGPS